MLINPLPHFINRIRSSINACILAALLALLVACRGPQVEELQSVSLVVTNGTLIDGTGSDPVADGLVAVQRNRIATVGQSAGFKFPAETEVIDATGGTILPGIFNSHVHKAHTAATRRDLFLLDGVTSVCDSGVSSALMQEFEQDESQFGPAALAFKSGPPITAPGGYPGQFYGFTWGYEIQGVDQAEMAVRDLYTGGADYIKVALEPGFDSQTLPVMSLQELRSVVTAVHANDLLVRAHVAKSNMLDIALEAGVDFIEHVPMPSTSYEDLESMFDDAGVFRIPSGLEAQLLRMVDQGVVLVPTLDVFIDDTYSRGNIEPETEIFNPAIPGIVLFFHDSGGIISVGNDYGNAGVQPEMPLHEMDLLQIAGLSPMEVLEAATRHAAYVCGQRETLGTPESGQLAMQPLLAPISSIHAHVEHTLNWEMGSELRIPKYSLRNTNSAA